MSKEIKKQVKRKRNKIISFRATGKEADLLDKKVENKWTYQTRLYY